ncbi:MAG: hypothetical protein Kow00128_08830 [Deltaproteobacteria bacterium]
MAERGRAVRGLLLLGLFCLATASCGTRIRTLYERVLGSPGYDRITRDHTRTREVHDGLEVRFILAATWLSPRWVQSFSEEYANIYYLDAERTSAVIDRWKAESESTDRFFVALFTPEEEGNDLERKETLWSLHLVRADETEVDPLYVRASSLKPDEVKRFFPYAETWYRCYEVAFPKRAEEPKALLPGAPRLRLVLTGVRGRAVLVWQ